MTRVSVAVMAHPKRADMVADLLTRLDRPATVVWDECNDRHDTGIRAVEAADPTCSHHLVIQDDALPCADLVAGVERALPHVPAGHPVSLYIGRVKPFRRQVTAATARADGASWITMAGVYWGPAIVVPTATVADLSAWWTTAKARKVTNYDRRLSTWFETQGRRCWYTWPSLVDHRGDESLARHHVAERRAHRFHDGSALAVDWSGPVVDMTRTDRLDRQRQKMAVR